MSSEEVWMPASRLRPLNAGQLIDKCRELADQLPDFAYHRIYVLGSDRNGRNNHVGATYNRGGCLKQGHSNNMGCLIGQAAQSLGRFIPESLEGTPVHLLVDINIIVAESERQREWLSRAQTIQDDGATWAQVIAITDAIIEEKFPTPEPEIETEEIVTLLAG